MASTIKLQSPAYDNAGLGESFLLPVGFVTHNVSSRAHINTLPGDVRILQDYKQAQEVVTVTGFLTDANAAEAGFDNAVHFLDGLRRIRREWPKESIAGAGVDWNNPSLPAGEGDTKTRARGKARLILDKAWKAVPGQFVNLFLYGTTLTYLLGPIPAATMRTRIPYTVTFIVADVRVGV